MSVSCIEVRDKETPKRMVESCLDSIPIEAVQAGQSAFIHGRTSLQQ
jgi:hypothetical protein